jgi:nitrogen fixation NifU-like protein
MNGIYKEKIIDAYKNPKNFGSLEDADVAIEDFNPGCGDKFKIYIKFDGENLKDIKFTGIGCVISTASASILTEFVKNKNINEIEKLETKDIIKLLGVELNPARIKCALLPLMIIKAGIKNYKTNFARMSSTSLKE